MTEFAGKHILIIVENLPVPFDRRVWQEATTLRESGADISVICPRMRGFVAPYENLEGVDIYRHPLPLEASGPLGYLIEYGTSIFWWTVLSWKVFFKKRFHVIHGCNPPDLIFLAALPFKLFGVKYIFDHHDINPEMYVAKFEKKGFFYRLMLLFERLTFFFTDYSIATNQSYRDIAIGRGRMSPDRVQVVRSGPKIEKLKLQAPKIEIKKGKKYLVGYLGVIGEQEGLDLLLKVARIIVDRRDDVRFAIVGGGTYLPDIQHMAHEMGLDSSFDFYGRVSDKELLDVINTCDVCVNPDTPSDMNNLSTMNKIMEYMALKKPIVQFDLKEGRFSAGDASLYVRHYDIQDFANKIEQLLDDPLKRELMGEFGRKRVINELSWTHESQRLVQFYRKILA